MVSISDLSTGERACLLSFGQTEAAYRRILLSLGITCGVQITITRVAPLGCPVQIEVRGTSLTLRKDEACHLVWERI